jgi:transposase
MQISNLGSPERVLSPSSLPKAVGRPSVNLNRARVVALRDGEKLSWRAIAKRLRVGVTTVRRAYQNAKPSGDWALPNKESGGSSAEGSTDKESLIP